MVGLDLGTRLIKVNMTKVRKRKDETIFGIDLLLPEERESLQKEQTGSSADTKKKESSAPAPKPKSSVPLRKTGKTTPKPAAPHPAENMFVEDLTSVPEQAHWNCVRKGKIHVLEIFAGSARFSQCCALSGLKVGTPVDIRTVMTSKGRHMVMEIIREQAPDVILMSPVCGPWSNTQNIQQDQQRVWEKRKRYLPMVEFVASIARYQLKHGRYFIIQNPQTSKIWYLNSMQQLFSDPSVTWGDFHFCAYGLKDSESGLRSVWKVKTFQWQLGTSSKKRKLGEGLWTEEPEDEQPGHQDWETYLDRLFTLLLAYALGAVKALDNAPSAKEEDVLGADTTRFVSVPLDVVMRYHARARRTSASLPHASRLAWLLQRDTEERADWVSRFRESTLTLGQVIKATYEARDAHWVPAGNFSAPTKERQQASPAKPAARGGKPPLAKPIAGRAVARAMRDGSALCQAFQHGQCKAGPSCPNGQHRCAAILGETESAGCRTTEPRSVGRRRSLEGALGGEGDSPIGSELSHPHTGSQEDGPLMVDLMCGPNMPLAKAFLFCGWRVLPIDWSLDSGHDLSNPLRQQALEAPLRSAAFTAAALDCSTKSRAREIPRTFADGRPGPKPLRSEGRSRVLSHPGLRDCRIGQLVGGPRRACPTPRATDAAAGGVWPEATLAGYRPPSYAQLGNDPAGHHTRTTTIASRGASEAAQGGAGSRRAGRWQASAGRGLCGAGPPLPPDPTVPVGITVRAGAHLYDGRLAATLRGLRPR